MIRKTTSWLAIGLLAGACTGITEDVEHLELDPADDDARPELDGSTDLSAPVDPMSQTPGFDMAIDAAGNDVELSFATQPGATLYTLWSSADPYFEPGDASAAAVDTSASASFTIPDGAIANDTLYWRVESDAGQRSTTVGRWVQELGPDVNLIGFPLLDTGVFSATDLVAANPAFDQVILFDSLLDGYLYWNGPGDPELTWDAGEAVAVDNGGQADVVRQLGHVPVGSDLAWEIPAYRTILSLPLWMDPTDAAGLTALVPEAISFNNWDNLLQASQTYLTDSGWGTNFTVEPGQGFMVALSASFQWPPGYVPTPQTCAEIAAEDPAATDGEYTLYYEGDGDQPWTAHCLDMAGSPVEYLPLVNVGPDVNFSQYTAGGPAPGTNVRTNYTHLRIDPLTLEIDTDDFTFSASSGQLLHGGQPVTQMPFAIAMACLNPGGTQGLANVDLTGTPFTITSNFCQGGWIPGGSSTVDPTAQIADLTGGGFCGWTSPSGPCDNAPQDGNSNSVLRLAYGPTP